MVAMAQAPIILLVEHEPTAAAELTHALSEIGCTVWHAESGADARAILKDARPDLILLDLTLPDVDGLVLCANLRNDAADVPFMICSAGSTAEKVLSFKLGAEDFVARPFEVAELQARVEAVLSRNARRHVSMNPRAGVMAIKDGPDLGRLRVDISRWRVTVDDKPLTLTPTEFQLLVFMARRPGEIISRQELARGVWGNESMSRSRTIDAYVRRISSKLTGSRGHAEDECQPRILNIRGSATS
jgi:two-component system, OmpR family, response regulator